MYVITIHMYVYNDVIIYYFIYAIIYICVCYYTCIYICYYVYVYVYLQLYVYDYLYYIYIPGEKKNNKSNKSQGLSETDHISVRLSG